MRKVTVYLTSPGQDPHAVKGLEIIGDYEVDRDGPFLIISTDDESLPNYAFNIDQVIYYTGENV